MKSQKSVTCFFIVLCLQLLVAFLAWTHFLPGSARITDAIPLQPAGNNLFICDHPLAKGSYTLSVDYSCDLLGSLELCGDDGADRPFYSTVLIHMYPTQTHKTIRTKLLRPCQSFSVRVHSNDDSPLLIEHISVSPNNSDFRFYVSIFLFCMILGDVIFLLRRWIWKNRQTIVPLLCITLFTSLPLFYPGSDFDMMHDLEYHFLRIEGIATELLAGHFPVKIQSIWADGYGYANSVFYGDLLLYFPAILCILGFPVDIAYRCYVLWINLFTCVFSYYSFKKIFGKNSICMCLTFLYCCASYRFINVFIRAAVGEYSAMTFLPFLFMVLFRIYTRPEEAGRHCSKYAILLALGMTGAISTHMLSTEMIIFIMAILCLLNWRITFQKGIMKLYIIAVGVTLLLNAYFIIPFIDYAINCPVRITNGLQNADSPQIQHLGARLIQYVQFLRLPFISSSGATEGTMMLTPGFLLMLSLIPEIVLIIIPQKKSGLNPDYHKYITVFFIASLLLLWVSSNQFPWDFLADHSILGRFLAQVQFPWRYLGIAVLFLCISCGYLFLHIQERYPQTFRYVSAIISLGCVLTCIGFTAGYITDMRQNAEPEYYYDTADLNINETGGHEYIPANESALRRSGKILCGGLEEIEILEKYYNHYTLSIKCLPGEEGSIDLPLYNYKGYQVTDTDHVSYLVDDSSLSDTVKFHLPAGYKGIVSVDFVPPRYWHIAEAVSLFSFLTVLFLLLRHSLEHSVHRMGCSKGDQAEHQDKP